jgi:hypothetical protein
VSNILPHQRNPCLELTRLRLQLRLQKRRLLPPWSGCHPPRLGYTRQVSGDLHPSFSHHQPCRNRGQRYRPTTRTHPPLYDQRMTVPPYPRLHELQIRLPPSHPPRHTRLNHTHPQTRCNSGIRTHIGKIKARNHSLGNDLADALAKQVAYGNPPDTTYTTGSAISIGIWTWPHTLIPQALGESTPHRYTNLNTDAHTLSMKHTHTPLS